MKKALRWYGGWVYELLRSIARMALPWTTRIDAKSVTRPDAGSDATKECIYCTALLNRYAHVCQSCGALL